MKTLDELNSMTNDELAVYLESKQANVECNLIRCIMTRRREVARSQSNVDALIAEEKRLASKLEGFK